MKNLRIKLFVLWLLCSSVAVSETLVLGVPTLKPFTYQEDGEIKGVVVKAVEDALKDSGIAYEFKYIENYSLILKAIRKKEIDGFFVATRNLERDKYGTFSKPILMDRYAWFLLNDTPLEFGDDDFIFNAKVGAVTNTNSFRLATRRGYQVYGQPSKVLAHNFINKNIDAVFATYGPFKYQLDMLDIKKGQYKIIIDSIRPFGIYISNDYLKAHPNALEKINKNITTLR